MKVNEVWKPVLGFEDLYQVSDMGNIRSMMYRGRSQHYPWKTPRILKQWSNHQGYRYVQFNKGSLIKQYRVHRLVLEAFCGPSPYKYEGGHLNGIKSDNRLKNLKWITSKENKNHRVLHGTDLKGVDCYNSTFTENQIRKIRRLGASGLGCTKIARMFKAQNSNICRILKREAWKHVV